MDASQLAEKMLQWEKMKRNLNLMEQEIKTAVLEIGKTQTVGNVRASYSKGRKKYHYQEAVLDSATQEDIDKHTTPKVDWRAVCKDLGWTGEEIGYTQGVPSVSLKLLD